jgi:hypothetical protein
MPARVEEIAAVRQQIINLLRAQMEALDSPLGLTDDRLSECYRRHERVQELRERLQALAGAGPVTNPAGADLAESTCPGASPLAASPEAAIRIQVLQWITFTRINFTKRRDECTEDFVILVSFCWQRPCRRHWRMRNL